MRRYVVALGWALVATGCSVVPTSGSQPSPTHSTVTGSSQNSHMSPTPLAKTGSPPPGATVVAGGCGSTLLVKGGYPVWLEPTVSELSNMVDVPYAISSNSMAAAFILGYPLKARVSHASVLWVVASPRQSAPLDIQASPIDSTSPLVEESVRAGASPGEIYPDGVTIPSPGCWHFSLRWATGQAVMDLLYA